MDTREFLHLFLSESREHLEGMNTLLTRAGQGGLDREEINTLFRHAHSLKGMSASMGFKPVTALAHAMEDLFHRWREGGSAPPSETLDTLLKAADALASQIDTIESGGDPGTAGEIVRELQTHHKREGESQGGPSGAPGGGAGDDAGSQTAGPGDGGAPDPGGAAGQASTDTKDGSSPDEDPRPRLCIEVALKPDAPLPAARALVVLRRLGDHGTIVESRPDVAEVTAGLFTGTLYVILASGVTADRLAAAILDLPDVDECRVSSGDRRETRRRVMSERRSQTGADAPAETGSARPDAVGSIRVATDRMDRLLDGIGELILDRERLNLVLKPEPGSQEAAILEGLGRTVNSLRDEVVTMRMIPFDALIPRLKRTVRDLARRLSKTVELAVKGTDVSLDRLILEEMLDPLQHIIRNSIDHGIESDEARRAAGKQAGGRITIDLTRHEDRVVLTVADDGRGIDPAGLRRTAIDRRFISREAAELLSDEEAFQLITIPGFSTATRTTEISGRGVGMDVVQNQLRKLGGHLTVRSTIGVGTRFEMSLPLTVTVARAFLCQAAGDIYAVPVAQVQNTVQVDREKLQGSRGEWVLQREDEVVTILHLAGLLDDGREVSYEEDFPALLYRVGERAYALAVDEILGEQEIVIKPLKHPLEIMPYYAGAAILNDGRIALILHPANLTHLARAA